MILAWNKRFILLILIANSLGITCIMMVSIIMASMDWDMDAYSLAIVPYFGSAIFYSCGKFFLECFFLFRVYTAFKNSSMFALSKKTVHILTGSMFILTFSWLFIFIYDANNWLNSYGYLIIFVFETILVVTLLFLFTKRLSGLILLKHRAHGHKISMETSSVNTQSPMTPSTATYSSTTDDLSPKNSLSLPTTPKQSVSISPIKEIKTHLSSAQQSKWIRLITRCILLSSISLITTILFGLFAFCYEEFGIHVFIVYGLWSIDMAANSFCLYLNFAFANDLYNRCCKICHGACQDLVQYSTAKKVLKVYVDEANLEGEQMNIVKLELTASSS